MLKTAPTLFQRPKEQPDPGFEVGVFGHPRLPAQRCPPRRLRKQYTPTTPTANWPSRGGRSPGFRGETRGGAPAQPADVVIVQVCAAAQVFPCMPNR